MDLKSPVRNQRWWECWIVGERQESQEAGWEIEQNETDARRSQNDIDYQVLKDWYLVRLWPRWIVCLEIRELR